jgi:hypothetical protein
MRKILALVAAAVLTVAGAGIANAANGDMTQMKGDWSIGWWDPNAPVAVRTLLTDDWELGAGLGFYKPEEGDTGFALSVMAVRRLIHASRAHLGVRPRLFKEFNTPEELLALGVDLTAEVEISSAVSVIAGHGIEYLSADTGGEGDDLTIFQTRPVTSSSVGFWVKLP